ncbi:MAG: ATP-binding protein, partial [Verrucomicrobiota bacterium]
YMDEIYGYLPPTANPPSKKPLMTMLKQARAFGLGVLLATQNPVDLDYKALSNIGTWFLGRLQTERDKARVLDGLEGVAASNDSGFDRRELEQLLAGLGSRVFLLNNVHDEAPVTFHVRWVMSYLRGPMTRGQIRKLMEPKRAALKERANAVDSAGEGGPARAEPEREKTTRPVVPRSIEQYFFPITDPRADAELVYKPAIVRAASVYISSSKMGIDGSVNLLHIKKIEPGGNLGPIKVKPRESKLEGTSPAPIEPCIFADLPAEAMQTENYKTWAKQFEDYIYREGGIELLHCPALDLYSQPGETEGAFRGRLAAKAREERDLRIVELKEKAEKDAKKLETRLDKAVDAVRVQRAQAKEASMSNWMTMGSTILGSLLGRGRLTATKVRTSATRMSRSSKEAQDVRIAEEKVREIEDEIDQLRDELDNAIDEIRLEFRPEQEALKKVKAKPYKKNISLRACGLGWLPYYRVDDLTIEPAWAG